MQTVDDAIPLLEHLVGGVFEATFAHFSACLRDAPDFAADFFDFCVKLLRRCSADVWRGCNLAALVGWASEAMVMPERPCVQQAANALSELLSRLSSVPEAQALLSRTTSRIMDVVLQQACSVAAGSLLRAYGDVLFHLISVQRPVAMAEAERLLSQEGYPTPASTMDAKTTFMKALHRDGEATAPSSARLCPGLPTHQHLDLSRAHSPRPRPLTLLRHTTGRSSQGTGQQGVAGIFHHGPEGSHVTAAVGPQPCCFHYRALLPRGRGASESWGCLVRRVSVNRQRPRVMDTTSGGSPLRRRHRAAVNARRRINGGKPGRF